MFTLYVWIRLGTALTTQITYVSSVQKRNKERKKERIDNYIVPPTALRARMPHALYMPVRRFCLRMFAILVFA